jgi:uncharacterized protein with PQ loop repeat
MDPVMNQVLVLELLYAIGVAISLLALVWFIPRLWRSYRERDSKGIAIAVLFIAVAGYGVWYSAAPFIPRSEKSIHREGTRLGYESMCKKAPICTNCESDSNCVVCGARNECLDMVDHHFNGCFNNLYEQKGKVPGAEFAALLDACLNQRAGRTYIRKMNSPP